MADYIVTFAPPTPNGGLHVGHLSGPYLAADVFARGRRLLGDNVTLVSYSDGYQSYLERKAMQLGKAPHDVGQTFHSEILHALKRAQIAPDIFYSALDSKHFLDAVNLFRKSAASRIRLTATHAPYCIGCQKWGYEAYGRGVCVQCGESTDHSQCETCACPPDVTGIRDVNCIMCFQPMKSRRLDRELLYIDPNISNLCGVEVNARQPLSEYLKKPFLQRPLIRWPIDRPGEYAIPCSQSYSGSIHTWFAGLAGYYAAAAALEKAHLWHDDECMWVAFAGFDCAFSHAVVYPTLLNSIGAGKKSYRLYTNSFLKLNGRDFSTSRGIAVWANDILEIVESDYLRFYLAMNAPETEAANFDTQNFACEVNRLFQVSLAQIIAHLEQSSSVTRGPCTDWISHWEKMRDQWRDTLDADRFSMRRCANIVRDGLEYLSSKAASISRRDLTLGLASWAALSFPLTPNLSNTLLKSLGVATKDMESWLTGKCSLAALSANPLDKFHLVGMVPSEQQVAALIRGG